MHFTDFFLLGLSNLWRTKLRTLLTILGVVIGIGALTSMVSFGTGMQKNITDAYVINDLFTSMTVSSLKIDLEELGSGDVQKMAGSLQREPVLLTDSILQVIKQLEGVAQAYPVIEIPARLKLLGDSASFNVGALPADSRNFKPYNDLLAGSFFSNDSAMEAVITEESLYKRFRIKINNKGESLSKSDSVKGTRLMHTDSIIGKSLSMVTMSMDPQGVQKQIFAMMGGQSAKPFAENRYQFRLVGILKPKGQFSMGGMGGSLLIPIGSAAKIPILGFTSVWDLLDDRSRKGSYSAFKVRLDNMSSMESVKKLVEEMGLGVFSLADQLQEIKRVFMVLNAALASIGAIALIVAALGITNTMVMSILERTREIGIMKAIGGGENDIRMIFFVEAAVIGFVGALFGLLLGWLVTKVANIVMNAQLIPEGVEAVDMFYFPVWLIIGAIFFSILISLLAGFYPAMRAARTDAVKALRHD
jgi:ABC-type antimicrobial peptide transport system permease subunit